MTVQTGDADGDATVLLLLLLGARSLLLLPHVGDFSTEVVAAAKDVVELRASDDAVVTIRPNDDGSEKRGQSNDEDVEDLTAGIELRRRSTISGTSSTFVLTLSWHRSRSMSLVGSTECTVIRLESSIAFWSGSSLSPTSLSSLLVATSWSAVLFLSAVRNFDVVAACDDGA